MTIRGQGKLKGDGAGVIRRRGGKELCLPNINSSKVIKLLYQGADFFSFFLSKALKNEHV